MIDESQGNRRPNDRQFFPRVFLRIYFIILFTSAVIGLTFSRQVGAILVFSLVSSLLVFICCNCGQCFKTQVISGHIMVGPPDMGTGVREQQVAYIIVTPRVGPSLPQEDILEPVIQPLAPIYPVYGQPQHHFQPPPTYEESQNQYK